VIGRDRRPGLPPTPIGFKIWLAFCGVLGVGMLGFVIWAVLQLLRILEGT
jgi:hypothetical protein